MSDVALGDVDIERQQHREGRREKSAPSSFPGQPPLSVFSSRHRLRTRGVTAAKEQTGNGQEFPAQIALEQEEIGGRGARAAVGATLIHLPDRVQLKAIGARSVSGAAPAACAGGGISRGGADLGVWL
ncbi:hypothetical protein Taro_012520 [Colocasia esculenta]|uniref:Uncharacterized protein n=1 Tax=Colocasia esculenta TaxID=4460 RepID=A0A843UJD0_COLES|nr:hypothetical protein [Colocasia esculenta]